MSVRVYGPLTLPSTAHRLGSRRRQPPRPATGHRKGGRTATHGSLHTCHSLHAGRSCPSHTHATASTGSSPSTTYATCAAHRAAWRHCTTTAGHQPFASAGPRTQQWIRDGPSAPRGAGEARGRVALRWCLRSHAGVGMPGRFHPPGHAPASCGCSESERSPTVPSWPTPRSCRPSPRLRLRCWGWTSGGCSTRPQAPSGAAAIKREPPPTPAWPGCWPSSAHPRAGHNRAVPDLRREAAGPRPGRQRHPARRDHRRVQRGAGRPSVPGRRSPVLGPPYAHARALAIYDHGTVLLNQVLRAQQAPMSGESKASAETALAGLDREVAALADESAQEA